MLVYKIKHSTFLPMSVLRHIDPKNICFILGQGYIVAVGYGDDENGICQASCQFTSKEGMREEYEFLKQKLQDMQEFDQGVGRMTISIPAISKLERENDFITFHFKMVASLIRITIGSNTESTAIARIEEIVATRDR